MKAIFSDADVAAAVKDAICDGVHVQKIKANKIYITFEQSNFIETTIKHAYWTPYETRDSANATDSENLANKYLDYEFLLPIHPNPNVKCPNIRLFRLCSPVLKF